MSEEPTAYPAVDAAPRSEPEPEAEPPLNRLSVVALVAAFVLPLVGIVLGHLSLRQLRRTGERGNSIAFAATVLAWVITVSAAVAITLYLTRLTGVLPA